MFLFFANRTETGLSNLIKTVFIMRVPVFVRDLLTAFATSLKLDLTKNQVFLKVSRSSKFFFAITATMWIVKEVV